MGMERFYHDDNDVDDAHFVAVAIYRIDEHQFHAGFVHDTGAPATSTQVMHMAGRSVDYCEYSLSEDHGLAVYYPNGSPIPKERMMAVTSFCSHVSNEGRPTRFPYSFSLESSLNEHGAFIAGDTDMPGFTCATFVLAAFDALGFNLLETKNWPVRQEDMQTQLNLMGCYSEYVSELGEEKLQDRLEKLPRIRPEEVAAGALQESHPATEPQIRDEVRLIKEKLEK